MRLHSYQSRKFHISQVMKRYRKIIIAVIVISGITSVLLKFTGMLADKFIFQPRKDTYPELEGVKFLQVSPQSDRIAFRYTAPKSSDAPVFLHCHGNAENLRSMAWRQEMFSSYGYGFFAFDYEGYGRSSGKASEAAAKRDVLAAWNYLTAEEKIPPSRIVIHGFSLGTGVATFLASQVKEAKALILEAPFTSTYAVAHLQWIPGNRFKSIDLISGIKFPVMIIHGDRDRIIPFSHGKMMYEKAPHNKQFFHVRGAGHNDLIATAGKSYWQQIKDFLD